MTTPFVTHIWDADHDYNNEAEPTQPKPDLVVERATDGTFYLTVYDDDTTEMHLGQIGADCLIQALGGATKVQVDVLKAERDAARENADARRQHIDALTKRNAELNMEINRQADVIAGLRADADEPQREIIALELNGEGEPNVNDVIVGLINVLRAGVSSFHISKEGDGWRILADQVRSYRPSLLDALTDARDGRLSELFRARRRDSASVEKLDQQIAMLSGIQPTNDQEN